MSDRTPFSADPARRLDNPLRTSGRRLLATGTLSDTVAHLGIWLPVSLAIGECSYVVVVSFGGQSRPSKSKPDPPDLTAVPLGIFVFPEASRQRR